jgi:aminomuconate-semialdehyde/2-hydroxymuconate-6-semialdehyde dehydrogenase
MLTLENYINGECIAPIQGQYLPNSDPSTGKEFCQVPNSTVQDVDRAVEAAKAAFSEWKNLPAEDRFKLMNRLADLIDESNETLALAESKDQGKNIKTARAEIKRAAQNFRFFATAVQHFASESHAVENDSINYTLRQPIGIVACISPWNLPLYLFTWKIAPALAAGNCVIAKPSEVTPYTAFLLGELCIKAGFPKGALNILHGDGPSTGKAMVEHPQIKAISFTGSTRAGKEIATIASPAFKKVSLELGGKNPNVVFADCDFDLAVRTSVQASFQNQGEICLCGSRVYIQRSIYEPFKQAFIERASKLKVGPPLDESCQLGAIVSKVHFDKVMGCIETAKAEGGTILVGGNAVQLEGEFSGGWYIQPTVIEGLSNACKTNQEEIFGPVVTLQAFDTEEEALALANDCGYGLASTVFTTDLNKAHRFAAGIQTGMVWINCWLHRDLRTPFGGVKSSGTGREGGWEAMRFFTEPKNVCIKYS